MISNADTTSDTALDFVPMVDVLFNLLIFFLLATSLQQTEREMKIALPQAAAAGPLSAALREIIINVDSQGLIIVAGQPITTTDLSEMIRSAVKVNPDQKVSIRGDRATAYENVSRVLDVCKGAGIQEPYLETVPVE